MSKLHNSKKNVIPGYLCSSRINFSGPQQHSDRMTLKGFGGYMHILGLINAIQRHAHITFSHWPINNNIKITMNEK